MAIAFGIAIMVVSVVMIVAVLMQDSETGGLSALGGSSDTFYGKNKSKALNAKLALLTKICAGVFVVLCVLMLILCKG